MALMVVGRWLGNVSRNLNMVTVKEGCNAPEDPNIEVSKIFMIFFHTKICKVAPLEHIFII